MTAPELVFLYVAVMSVLDGCPGGFENAKTTETPSFSKTVRGGMVGSVGAAGGALRGEDDAGFPVPDSSAKGSDAARGGGAEIGERGFAVFPPPISTAKGSCEPPHQTSALNDRPVMQ